MVFLIRIGVQNQNCSFILSRKNVTQYPPTLVISFKFYGTSKAHHKYLNHNCGGWNTCEFTEDFKIRCIFTISLPFKRCDAMLLSYDITCDASLLRVDKLLW